MLLQNNFMYLCVFPTLPMASWSTNLLDVRNYFGFDMSLLVRSVTIPQKKAEYTEVVTGKNDRFTLPNRMKIDHEFAIKMFMTDGNFEFDRIVRWGQNIKKNNLTQDQYKTDMYVIMLDMNYIPTKIIQYYGVYPLSTPGIGDLSYEGVDETVELECSFNVDDVNYNEDGALDFMLGMFRDIKSLFTISQAVTR